MRRAMEFLLWNTRMIVTVPVFASLVISAGVILLTTVDVVALLVDVLAYVSLDAALQPAARVAAIAEVVAIVDGYLVGAILIIFALGLYELFIDKIDFAEGSELASRLLLMKSLDDLKDRLANMILVILIVKFFQIALSMKYQEPLDLLYLSIGIVLIGGALFLTGRAKPQLDKSGK